MTKLEELSTLLVNEIEDFNKGVTKLEKINDQISTTKIQMDLREYKTIIEQHQRKMNQLINTQEQFESRFDRKLEQAKIYPNWAVIVFIVALLFGAVSTPYAYILKRNANKIEKEAYQKGAKTYNEYLQTFFENHPKTKQAFEKWEEKSN